MIGAHSQAEKVLASLAQAELNTATPHLKKKEKQQLKHQAFIDRLSTSPATPYSKSHNRRLKRKARDQLGPKLDDLNAALDAMSADGDEEHKSDIPGITVARSRKPIKPSKAGMIGEGKGATLTKSERKAVLLVLPVSFLIP